MSSQPATIRHSDLLHRLVLDRTTTEELGRVEVVWMHPPVHRVLGFICKSNLLGGKRFAFNLKQLQRLGTNSIIVSSQPVETNATEVGHLESLIGLELWTEAGTQLGRITDCLFNLHSGVILAYLFRSEGWRGFTHGVYQLPAQQIVSFGKKRILVSEAASRHGRVYEAGVEQKVSQVGERVRSTYTEAAHDLQESLMAWRSSLSEQAQTVKQQAKQRFGHLKADAGQQVRSFQAQATQSAKNLGQQLQQETQTWAQKASQQGQAWIDHLDNLQEQDAPLTGDDEFDDDVWPWPDDASASASDPLIQDWEIDSDDAGGDNQAQANRDNRSFESPPTSVLQPEQSLSSKRSSDPSNRDEDIWLQDDPDAKAAETWVVGCGDRPSKDLEEDDPWI